MRLQQPFEAEVEQIRADTSEEAMADLWAEILAGLRGVEPHRFSELFGKALKLAFETLARFPELQAKVEDRLDEISLEMQGLKLP